MTFPVHPFRIPRPRRVIGGSDLAVLVVAHDRPDCVFATLDALSHQTVVPRRVTVLASPEAEVAVEAAAAHGAGALLAEHAADALNTALAQWLEEPPTFVLVIDADTRMPPGFVAAALRAFAADDGLGVVSGRASVITGTATVFRTAALQTVAGARGRGIPGPRGSVFHPASAVGCAELALAVQLCGWGLSAPAAVDMLRHGATTRADASREPARLRPATRGFSLAHTEARTAGNTAGSAYDPHPYARASCAPDRMTC